MKQFLIVFAFFAIQLSAQSVDTLKFTSGSQTFKVDSISIKGNEITEEFVILREITIEVGERINKTELDYNRERIYSLGLFNYVNVFIINTDGKNVLLIDVFEKWYLYPIPFVFFNGGAFKNPSYGLSFLLENFRGRDERISAFIVLGYDPAASIQYYNPYLDYENDIGFGFALGYQDFTNKSDRAAIIAGENFDYTIYTGTVLFSKRFDLFNILEVSTGFSYIEEPGFARTRITASGESIDRSPFLGLEYTYDSRDLKQFPKRGLYTNTSLLHKGFGLDGIAYQIFNLDVRQYNRLFERLTARWRLVSRNTFGKVVPYYDYSFLGYEVYVRGHAEGDIDGKHYLLGSVEVSYTIIEEWDLSLNLPLLPRNLTSTRIGMSLNIFTDTGTTFDDFDTLKDQRFLTGYGFGLNILFLPFNSVRFEYAFDQQMNGEFLIGLGFSF